MHRSKVYGISRHSLSRRYDICPVSHPNQPIATAHMHTFSGPDLTLHASADETGPILATLDSSTFSSSMKIGLSDPKSSDPQAVQYTKLEKSGWSDREYSVPVIVDGGRQPRVFSWRRTRHEGVSGASLNALSSRNYKMVDEKGTVLAVFTSESLGWNTVGTLEIRVDMGEFFDRVVWITILGVCETLRKKRNASSSAAGSSAAA